MSGTEQLTVDNQTVAKAWQDQLPGILNQSDQCKVVADEGDPNALRVNIQTGGRSDYNFDFKVSYVDSREVDVQLVDVEQGGLHIDENTEIIQNLAEDYVRHLHECAQAVQNMTNR
jgi:Fe-S cluster assembly iron-binding protein IscA